MLKKVRIYDYISGSYVTRYRETDPKKAISNTIGAKRFNEINRIDQNF